MSTFINLYCYDYDSEHKQIVIKVFSEIFIYQFQNEACYSESCTATPLFAKSSLEALNFNTELQKLAADEIDSRGNKKPLNIAELVFDFELQEKLYKSGSDVGEIIFAQKLLWLTRNRDVKGFLELIHEFSEPSQYNYILKSFRDSGLLLD